MFNNTAIGVNNTAGYFGALSLNAQNSYKNRSGVGGRVLAEYFIEFCWLRT